MKPDVPTETVDWAALHERLARAEAATDAALDPSSERGRQIMDERARILAQAPPEARQTAGQVELFVFSLSGTRYGIETRYVREVVRLAEITPVPGVTDCMVGVTSVRGEILPVVDPRRIFGEQGTGLTAHMILCGEFRAELGMLAVQLHDVATVPGAEIFEPPGMASGIRLSYLRGITKGALVVLDGVNLLADERLLVSGAQGPNRQQGG